MRQYGGGRLLAQSITMRRVYRPDNQQTQLLLPRLRRPSKWGITVCLVPNDIASRKCCLTYRPPTAPVTVHSSHPHLVYLHPHCDARDTERLLAHRGSFFHFSFERSTGAWSRPCFASNPGYREPNVAHSVSDSIRSTLPCSMQ